jgi:hypothetical protein
MARPVLECAADMRARAWVGWALAVSALAVPSRVTANPAAAEALFRDGRRLMEQGQLDLACAKLAESQRLDASAGTLGSLAQCHEKQGKTATAWAEFLSASTLAAAQGKQAVAQAAKERAAALEGKLVYLTIKVVSPVAGLVVKRDDQIIAPSAFDTRLPVDPGTSTLRAEAPGHQPFVEQLTLTAGKPDNVVVVPPLKKAAEVAPVPSASPATSSMPHASAAASAPAPPPTAPGKRPERRSLVSGYVLGGAGFAALGVGTFLGLSSLSDYRAAERACPSRTDCSSDALTLRDRSQSKAWGANIGVGLGVVGIALGSYLLFSSSDEGDATAVRVGGNVARDGAAVHVAGGF